MPQHTDNTVGGLGHCQVTIILESQGYDNVVYFRALWALAGQVAYAPRSVSTVSGRETQSRSNGRFDDILVDA